MRWRSFILAASIWVVGSGALAADASPRRVVSFNLCADQLLVALADPGQIAGLSPYAADPSLSVVREAAKAFPRLDWNAESVVRLAPDLILAGPSDRTTEALLAATGTRVEKVALVSDLAGARTQIRQVAALLGHPARGDALIARIDAAADRLRRDVPNRKRTALIVERGGYVSGPGSLAGAMLGGAGFVAPHGAPGGFGGFVSLEGLLTLRPDLILTKDAPAVASDQGALFLMHPALAALYPPERRIALPSRYVTCGGPALAEGLEYLARVLPASARKKAYQNASTTEALHAPPKTRP